MCYHFPPQKSLRIRLALHATGRPNEFEIQVDVIRPHDSDSDRIAWNKAVTFDLPGVSASGKKQGLDWAKNSWLPSITDPQRWAYGDLSYYFNSGHNRLAISADLSSDFNGTVIKNNTTSVHWSKGASGRWYSSYWTPQPANSSNPGQTIVHKLTSDTLTVGCAKGTIKLVIFPLAVEYSGGKVAGPIEVVWTAHGDNPTVTVNSSSQMSVGIANDMAASFDSAAIARRGWTFAK
jgi:hypothetical protein